MHMQRLARSAWLRGPQALAAAALVAGLAACGHAAPPDPGAEAADATAAGTWGDMKRNDPLRPPPAGTLHYTVELTGDVHKTGPHAGERRDARIRRRIEVTSRMQGVLVNGDLGAANPDRSNPDRPRDNHPAQPPKTIIDDLSRQAAACKGDSACMMKISMKLAADSKAQEEIQRVGNQQMAMIGRTVVWSRRAPCDGRATIDDSDDSARWGEDVGEGYHETGLDKRKTVARAGTSFD